MNLSLILLQIIAVMLSVVTNCNSKPAPDSAGIVPLPSGVAYGGIPYGSVSGQLSLYYGEYEPLNQGQVVIDQDKDLEEITEAIQLL